MVRFQPLQIHHVKIFLKVGLGAIVAVLVLAAIAVSLTLEPDRSVDALAQRWALPPSQFLELAGMRVHYRDEGPRDDPTPLVLIHGTSSSLHTWEGWVAAFKGRRRVITMDLPGFGLTGPQPEDDYRIGTYARFMLAFLDRLGVNRCVLAGNSLGGSIAWQVALAEPARVERLILVDAAGYSVKSTSIPLGFRIARTPVLNRIMLYTLPRSLVEASVRNVYGDPARVTPDLVDRYFELTLREGNRRAVTLRFEQSDWGADAPRIKGVTTPTLILWGGRDRLIPAEDARAFERDIAGSKLVIFDDLGHVPHEEEPARTAAAVKAFLGL
jgi:pimeloyl-ACP methyl ester carboxylesterase